MPALITPSPQAAPSIVFTGYSTQGVSNPRDTSLSDIALIERDLMNAFMTRRGERVMRPDYGCALWDYLMEPLTPMLIEQMSAEAKRIIESDARCTMQSFAVSPLGAGFVISAVILYQPWAVALTFTSAFVDRQGAELSGALA